MVRVWRTGTRNCKTLPVHLPEADCSIFTLLSSSSSRFVTINSTSIKPSTKVTNLTYLHHQCKIRASSGHHQHIISALSAHHQRIISASLVHHQCIIIASSVHHERIKSASWAHHQRFISLSSAHHEHISSISSHSFALFTLSSFSFFLVQVKSLGTGIEKIWCRNTVSEAVSEKVGNGKSLGTSINNGTLI